MANIKSSKKSIRKIEKRTMRNKAEKSRIKTASKKLQLLKDGGDAEAIKAAAKNLVSIVDKAGKHGVWHKNKVNRVKSRLSSFVFGADLKKPKDATEAAEAVPPAMEDAEATEAVVTKEVSETTAKKSIAKATSKKKVATAKKSASKKATTKKTATTRTEKGSSKKAE